MSSTLVVNGAQPAPVGTGAQLAVQIKGLSKQFVERRTTTEILRHPFAKRYQQALSNVTCDIAVGEFFGLLGPNGAGKTTLFKVLASFVLPDEGTALVHDVDLRRDPARVRQLVTPAVADERSLRWRLTARENLRLFATLYDVPTAEIAKRVDELLEAVGLQDTRHKMVGQFSTGMKQRLLIARALIPRPRVLLLDEPTRGLDPLLARTFRAFLREEIGHRHGCTVLLATHNAEEAFELCDRVGVLERGRLLTVGPARDLREQFGRQQYLVWTATPDHRAFHELERRAIARIGAIERVFDEGWVTVELEITGGIERAADVVRLLVSQGAHIARFERVGTSLADLIERVVQSARDPGEPHGPGRVVARIEQ
jgi:ABC-2 type transport system ATP-binding protein